MYEPKDSDTQKSPFIFLWFWSFFCQIEKKNGLSVSARNWFIRRMASMEDKIRVGLKNISELALL
jgi:hypothetical protein